MRNEWIYTKECLLGNEETLKYFVYCKKSQDVTTLKSEENKATQVYEIKVEKWKDSSFLECESTGGLTFNRHKAVDFMEILCRNKITPMCLLEVTDDCFYVTMGGES